MKVMKKNQPLSRIFAIPIALNVLAAAGLAAGLFGDGAFDAMSWLLLALPLMVAAWCFSLGRGHGAKRTIKLRNGG